MVAPIALYPDALLSQVLMAATYPLEVVEAARWVKANPKVTGEKLEPALKDKDWDPSVKSLCAFPTVLQRMNENLQWTRDLGDAMRKAYDAGTLKSSKEQTVTEKEDKIIIIESAQPDVIYVPTYYPTAVYGTWAYPTYYYPPMYVPPPAGSMFFSFAAGMFWGAAIWGGCHWGWGHSEVNINVNRYNNFVSNTDRTRVNQIQGGAGNSNWNHKAEHRRGVAYQDTGVAQRYGASAGQTRVSRDQARGYGDRSSRPSAGTRDTPHTGNAARPTTGNSGQRPSGGSTRPSTTPSNRSSRSSGSFTGSRNPSMERASSSRGQTSRSSYGGGGRSGGGRSGGGRGGRR
jgi:hypothetical protein